MKHIITRLRQPSTYAGLMGLAMLFGATTEDFTQWADALAGVFAFAAIFLNEGA